MEIENLNEKSLEMMKQFVGKVQHQFPGVTAKIYPMLDRERIECLFTYHAPKGSQPDRYNNLREKAKALALLVHDSCPDSAERTLAIRYLQQAIMWANASIAINE